MTLDPQSKVFNNIDFKTLSRSISYIENEVAGYEDILKQLSPSSAKIIGITGAPGCRKKFIS